MHKTRLFLLAMVSVVAVPATAQERVYVSQRSPASVHAFSFSGGVWTREDASPADPSTQRLLVGLDPFAGVTATDHLILTGSGFTGLGVGAVDPFTGIELPRVRTVVSAAGVKLSADQKHAILAGGDATGQPSVSVVDIDPASANFLKEVASLSGVATGRVSTFGAVELSGNTLYMALLDTTGEAGFAPNVKIVAIDVSDPLAPSVLGDTIVTSTLTPTAGAGTAVAALRAFNLGGTTYLFLCRRDLIILSAGAGGSLTRVGQVASNRPVAPTGRRFIRDVYAREVGGVRRAFAAADSAGNAAEEILAINLDTLSDDQLGSSVISYRTMSTSGTNDFERLRVSLDGSRLYVLSPGGDGAVASLASLDITGVVNESTPVAVLAVDGTTQSAPDLDVRLAVSPVAGGTISSVSVSGATPANVLVNDVARTVIIEGGDLSDSSHVFVGLDRLAIGAVTATSVSAVAPVLLPAGNRPVVVVGSNGAVSAFGGPGVPGALTVVNSATLQPPELVYAAGTGINRVAILHAATETEIVGSFPVSDFPTNMAVSPDGSLLFISQFTASRVEVYSLVADSVRGWSPYQRVANLHVGGAPQALAMKKDGSRIYVSTLDGYVAAIDSSARPPVLIDVDNDIDTTDPGLNAGLSPGLSRIAVATFDEFGNADDGASRSITLSPDDQWLYVARSNAPHIVAVHVDDDLVTPADTTFYSIPTVDALPPPPNFRRVDGLVVRGSRMYFASSGDSSAILRLFDVSGASIAPATPASLALPSGAAPGVRTLALSPDGKLLYAACRTPGTDLAESSVHVLNTTTDTWVAGLGLGSFASQVSVSPTGKFAYVGSAERDVTYTIDARSGPSQHSVISVTGGPMGGNTAVSPGLFTPAGSSVEVAPASGVTITYPAVTIPGNTAVTSSNATAAVMPSGFHVLNAFGNPVYHEIRTTAGFTGPALACFSYSNEQVAGVDEADLRLMHEEAGVFVDRTAGPPATDASSNRLCTESSTLGRFAMATNPSVLSISDASISEGNSGTTMMTFTVSRSGAANAVSFTYATEDGFASAPGDYTATSGTGSIAAGGAGSTTISVPIVGDSVSELHETFTVRLLSATGGTILDGVGVGTIRNDDPRNHPRPVR